MDKTYKILKNLRQERGLKQEDLAKAIGFQQSIISDWESGKKRPGSNALVSLSKFFGVSTDYILGLEDETGERSYAQLDMINPNRHKMMRKLDALDIDSFTEDEFNVILNATVTTASSLRQMSRNERVSSVDPVKRDQQA